MNLGLLLILFHGGIDTQIIGHFVILCYGHLYLGTGKALVACCVRLWLASG